MSDELYKLLRNMPVFGGLNNDSLQLIIDESNRMRVPPGDYFFHQGEAAKSLYVIESGVVIVERNWHQEVIKLGRLHTGDCFGEMSLMDMQPRSASVRAEEACTAIEISLKSLHRLYQQNIEQYAMIMMNMGREVSRRLRAADERLFALEQKLPELCT